MQIIETYKVQITKLCEQYGVKSLYSFGSVNSEKFSSESDIDLVVDLNSTDPLEYTENYFDLKFALEKLLQRQIDLLESKSIRNPFLKKKIDNSKVLVYGR